MANVTINGVAYTDVKQVDIPLTADLSQNASFFNTDDATLDNGNKMLASYTGYGANGVKYTGSIATRTGADLTASGDTVTVPAGYYASNASKAVAGGSATTPTTSISVTPSITISSGGLITASASGSQSITPTVSAGYVSSGTSGTVSVTGSNTKQMTVQAAQTITPTTSNQTIASGTYLTGTQTIQGDANLQAQYIKSGITIFGISGSMSAATVSQDSVTKVLSIS